MTIKFCRHDFKDVKVQRTKNTAFGFAGCELPGMRVKQVCKKCDKIRFLNLNLMMPRRYLYREEIWNGN